MLEGRVGLHTTYEQLPDVPEMRAGEKVAKVGWSVGRIVRGRLRVSWCSTSESGDRSGLYREKM